MAETKRRKRMLVLLVVALIAAGCSSGSSKSAHTAPVIAKVALGSAGVAPYKAGGSVGQVWVTGAHPGEALQLVAADGSLVAARVR